MKKIYMTPAIHLANYTLACDIQEGSTLGNWGSKDGEWPNEGYDDDDPIIDDDGNLDAQGKDRNSYLW